MAPGFGKPFSRFWRDETIKAYWQRDIDELSSPPQRRGRLGRGFFSRNTVEVARELLGCLLVRRIGRTVLSGKIVEVEAYRGSDDPAIHSYRGATRRSSIMFGEAGHVYVFFRMAAYFLK